MADNTELLNKLNDIIINENTIASQEKMRLFQSLCKLIIADIRYVNSSVAGQSF